MSATCDDLEEWGPAAVSGAWEVFDRPARAHDADAAMLASVMDFSVRPNMRAAAATIATLWAWAPSRKATCPACGAPPLLADAAADGTRTLRCVRCAAAWPVCEDVCPTCGPDDHHRRMLASAERQSSPRAECCDACGHYLKVIATSEPLTPGTLLTRDIETGPLDAAALKAGFV